MSDRIVPESFDFLLDREKIKIEEDKIIFNEDSYIIIILSILAILSPFFIGIFHFFTSEKDVFGYHNIDKNLIKIESFFVVVIALAVVYGLRQVINAYKVIDFKSKKIYRVDNILGMDFMTNIIEIDDIDQVANNVIAKLFSPGGKSGMYNGKPVEVHPETRYFQKYYLSFLLKSGKLINFYEFGILKEDYKDSVRLAKVFSEYFSKRLVVCDSKKTLVSYIDSLGTQIIEPTSEIERLGWAFFIFFILPILVVIIINLYLNYSGYYDQYPHPFLK